MSRIVLLCLLFAGLMACGSDELDADSEETLGSTDPAENGDGPSEPAPVEEPDEVDAPEPVVEPPAFPVYESIRFRRQLDNCVVHDCLEELEFAFRSDSMVRRQQGVVIDRVVLSDDHALELRELINEPAFLATMTSDSGFRCPSLEEEAPRYQVTLTLFVYEDVGDLVRYAQDISTCYASERGEFPDRFVDFAENMGRIYRVE